VSGGRAVRQHHSAFARIASHRHLEPYATLVLTGGYQEAGESGRWKVEAGMVVVHAAGEAHADWFADRSTRLIDFELDRPVAAGVYRCGDADMLAQRLLERGRRPHDSLDALEAVSGKDDWPDRLASDLRRNAALSIGAWAGEHGLRFETVSRGFTQAYGVTPAQFRLGVRINSAVNSLTAADCSLADVAFQTGFADQPHMTRAIRAAFGVTPAELRRIKSVQYGRSAAA
jgi:AraC-like DNA-binding protein